MKNKEDNENKRNNHAFNAHVMIPWRRWKTKKGNQVKEKGKKKDKAYLFINEENLWIL